MPAADELICDALSDEIIETVHQIATTQGTSNVNVRKVINEMGVTNRVFYNRFHNIEEVLEILYYREITKMRDTIQSDIDVRTDLYGYVMDVATKILVGTYDVRKQFSQYVFEYDSRSKENCRWWTDSIKRIIEIGKETGQLKDVDSDKLSYAIWCFFRGYNVDAVKRNLTKEDAIENFQFGLSCIFNGIR